MTAGGDSALVRAVRWRLLAWSGGTTLVVLVALGALTYAAVASSLTAAGVDQLRARASEISASAYWTIMSPTEAGGGSPGRFVGMGAQFVVVDQGSVPGLVLGGPTSGTLAFVVGPGSGETAATPFIEGLGLPDTPGIETAQSGAETIVEADLAGVPARILSVPVDTAAGTIVVQVIGDRTAEIRTLGVLLVVLLAGGLVALAMSIIVGWLYADRALVPIRDSLRRQREFAADASHELRTPLAVIRGTVEGLRRHPDRPPAEVASALGDAEAEIDRLAAMVDELLLLARTDSGVVEVEAVPVDLGEVVLDAAESLARLAADGGVRLEVDAEPVPMTGDPIRLRQLVTILADNAIRHAPEGSAVKVRVAVVGHDGARLIVEDRGPGFRPDDLGRVFDRFWRAADAPVGGTGLGLAIAAWIVDRHGGRITAANRAGGGARLEVVLPVH